MRLIYRLALHGDSAKGQMGVKNIVSYFMGSKSRLLQVLPEKMAQTQWPLRD